MVHQTQAVLGHDLEVSSATGRGQGEGALPSRNGALVLAHGREIKAHMVSDQAEPSVIA
jgi:hypothetical protein